MTTVVTGLW